MGLLRKGPRIVDVLSTAGKVIDDLVPDKDLANQIKGGVVKAEIMGESPVQRNWRPHLMYLIMGLLVWLILVGPIIDQVTGWMLLDASLNALERVPDKLWGLLTIGLGGYVLGRSGWKMVKAWKK